MTDTAILERTTNAAPARRAPTRKDDAAMLKAAASLTRDLNEPRSAIYLGGHARLGVAGYAGLFAAMFVRSMPTSRCLPG